MRDEWSCIIFSLCAAAIEHVWIMCSKPRQADIGAQIITLCIT